MLAQEDGPSARRGGVKIGQHSPSRDGEPDDTKRRLVAAKKNTRGAKNKDGFAAFSSAYDDKNYRMRREITAKKTGARPGGGFLGKRI